MALGMAVARDARRDAQREPLRLLWLIDSLTMGGAESLTVAFARAARARGIEVTVCARASVGGNPLEEEIRSTGVDFVSLEARNLRDLRAFRRLVRVIRGRRIDVVHAHLTYAAIWGAFASFLTRRPLVASLHVLPGTESDAPVTLRERIRERLMITTLNHHASKVLMVSDAMREAWATKIEPAKLEVVHNGVPAATEKGVEPRGGSRTGFTVTTIAVLREGKGIDVLIEAARQTLETIEDVEFVVVGDGPMRREWQERTRGLPFRWEGFQRDVGRYLEAADVFVLPTLADAFPTVLLEAMSAGVPVIASEVGGVPEIVGDLNGILVQPGDAHELASAITRALRDDRWRARASLASRSRFEERFSVDRWIDRLEAVYAGVRR